MHRFRTNPSHSAAARDSEARRQAALLAASLDAAEDEMDRDGPVSREQLAAMLAALEEEWAGEQGDDPSRD